MIKQVFIIFTMVLIGHFSYSQFNEMLDKDIASLRSKYKLDSIPKKNGQTDLNTLNNISRGISKVEVNKHLKGAWWRYSHTVYPEGKQIRISNARGVYKFYNDTEAYFIERNQSDTTWCKWLYEADSQFLLKMYKDKSLDGSFAPEYMNIHYITADRLVFARITRSARYPNTSRIIFDVYFRR